MRIVEMRFTPKEGLTRDAFELLLADLRRWFVRNGLILEGAAQSWFDGETMVWRIVAQDDDAIAEENMSFDTRESLSQLIKRCEGLPQVIPMEESADSPHCTCQKPTALLLQSPAEWIGSPVRCCDCRKSVPLYKIVTYPNDRDFELLLHWRKLRRGFLEQLGEKLNSGYAYDMLNNCLSELSVAGRRQAALVEKCTGVITLYPLFSRFERLPDRCPQCGGNFINPYKGVIPYERFCRQCRLVM